MKYISNSHELFRTRTREAVRFLTFLKIVNKNNAKIVLENKKTKEFQYSIEAELKHILKANFCLLLYNAMEGIFTQLIEDINDSIIENSVKNIDDLKSNLFKHILMKFKNSNDFSYNSIQSPLGSSIMQFWIDEWKKVKEKPPENRNKENSGNIDGKIIHENLLIRYGIVSNEAKKPLKNFTHWSLQLNKDRRNHLAHGEKSFVDLGRDLSIEDLTREAKSIYRIFKNITKEINNYLSAQGYLKTSTWQAFL